MNKIQIVNKIHKQTGYDKKEVMAIANEFMQLIKDSLKDGEEVFCRGFGTFQLVKRKAKIARDLNTNTDYPIPAKYVVKFKPTPDLKTALGYLEIKD